METSKREFDTITIPMFVENRICALTWEEAEVVYKVLKKFFDNDKVKSWPGGDSTHYMQCHTCGSVMRLNN